MHDGKISTAVELFVKAQYMYCMQDNIHWYWEQKSQHNNIIFTTLTIANPFLYIVTITKVTKIPKSVCNKNEARKDIQKTPICLTDSDRYFILNKINLETQLNIRGKNVDARCEYIKLVCYVIMLFIVIVINFQ